MKKIIVFALLFCMASALWAQRVAMEATKMNVLYIGVENPLRIVAENVPYAQLNATIDKGTIDKRKDYFLVRVKQPGIAKISVKNGNQLLTTKEFRVKRVPSPVAQVARLTGGDIPKHVLLAQKGVEAVLPNFDFDLSFDVVGFTLSTTINGYSKEATSNSALFTANQKDLIKQAPRGTKIYIEDIKAKGPDGTLRALPPMAFRIQ